MAFPLTPQTIAAIARVICGTDWDDHIGEYRIGISRSNDLVEDFLQDCGLPGFSVRFGQEESVRSALRELNNDEVLNGHLLLASIVEQSIHPADYRDRSENLVLTLAYVNDYLRYDGLVLQKVGDRLKLLPFSDVGAIFQSLWKEATRIGLDTVELELDRIRKSISEDPEDSVTAACAVVESVCRSIIVALGKDLPKDKTVSSLYGAVKRHLNLSPDREDRQGDEDADIRAILGAMSTLASNVGALRTKAGDAHGREHGYRRIDSRIARLAVNSASTLCLFLLETWQLLYPDQTLSHFRGTN